MDSGSKRTSTRNATAKPFIFGLILGLFLLYVLGTSMPESLGLRYEQDVLLMEELARNSTVKLQQCLLRAESSETREKDATQNLESCKAGKVELEAKHGDLEKKINIEREKNDKNAQEVEELKKKEEEVYKSLTDRDAELAKLKTEFDNEVSALKASITAEQDRNQELQQQIANKANAAPQAVAPEVPKAPQDAPQAPKAA